MDDRADRWWLGGLLAVTAVVYAPSAWGPWLYEDAHGLTGIVAWSWPGRGLTAWTWAVVGLHPGIAHLLNVGLHLVNGTLVARVARRLAGPLVGLCAAAVFLWHPLSASSVLYVTGRADLLVTLFTLLALAGVLRGTLAGWLLALVACGAAAVSKEVGLIAALLVGWTLFVWSRASWWWMALVTAGGVAVAWDRLAGWIGLSAETGDSWGPVIGAQLVAVWHLLTLVVWPVGVSIDHDVIPHLDRAVWWAGGLTLVAVAVGVWAWRRAPLLAWGIGWVALCVGPRFLFPTNEVLAEYQMSTAMVGISVVCGAAVAWWLPMLKG